mmetsp:Transcript_7131/g.22014  ORF Transcript_7131/g.22014 Transcript_7131/m.22014 type:complete len:231 (+) Transcript_7131:1431-2123(+)
MHGYIKPTCCAWWVSVSPHSMQRGAHSLDGAERACLRLRNDCGYGHTHRYIHAPPGPNSCAPHCRKGCRKLLAPLRVPLICATPLAQRLLRNLCIHSSPMPQHAPQHAMVSIRKRGKATSMAKCPGTPSATLPLAPKKTGILRPLPLGTEEYRPRARPILLGCLLSRRIQMNAPGPPPISQRHHPPRARGCHRMFLVWNQGTRYYSWRRGMCMPLARARKSSAGNLRLVG